VGFSKCKNDKKKKSPMQFKRNCKGLDGKKQEEGLREKK